MPAKIAPLGINLKTGLPIFEPIDPAQFGKKPWFDNVLTRALSKLIHLGELMDDPKRAGWNIIVHKDDIENPSDIRTIRLPIQDEIAELCEIRGKSDPAPLIYDCENTPAGWSQWLDTYSNIRRADTGLPDQFLLIIGSPEKIPFGFQARLNTVAAVGRVFFSEDRDYQRYFRKIIDIDKNKPALNKTALFFAPCHDAITRYSAQCMALPIADSVNKPPDPKDTVTGFAGNVNLIDVNASTRKANRNAFFDAVREKPCLVYTAGHGLFCPDDRNRIYNGSICCPRSAKQGISLEEDTINAGHIARLDPDEPFLEGAVFFQFACFGYGTPHISTIDHWMYDSSTKNRDPDFLSALPQKMLAHPRGPIAYVGHTDAALLLGFYDKSESDRAPLIPSDRLKPFERAIDRLLKKNHTIGHSLFPMRNSLIRLNREVIEILDEHKKDTHGIMGLFRPLAPEMPETMLRLIDARNFMIFGDPAVRLNFSDLLEPGSTYDKIKKPK
jgi:hypothetical protein